jgi:hypothetical protein
MNVISVTSKLTETRNSYSTESCATEDCERATSLQQIFVSTCNILRWPMPVENSSELQLFAFVVSVVFLMKCFAKFSNLEKAMSQDNFNKQPHSFSVQK